MLCTQRKKWASFGQSPSCHWRPASSAMTPESQGSKRLPAAQPGLAGDGSRKMVFYEIIKKLINQSQGKLLQALSTTMALNFLVSETLCTIKNDWIPKKLLFIGIISINYLMH